MVNAMSNDSRLEKLEKRLDHIEKRLRKTVRERELSLKEKFGIHDRAQSLLAWFEAIISELPHENVWFCVTLSPESVPTDMRKAPIKNMKELVKDLSKLVDNALGVKFP